MTRKGCSHLIVLTGIQRLKPGSFRAYRFGYVKFCQLLDCSSSVLFKDSKTIILMLHPNLVKRVVPGNARTNCAEIPYLMPLESNCTKMCIVFM